MTKRRTLIQSLALAPLLSRCVLPSTSVSGSLANYTLSGIPLRRVKVSEERVIRTITGLRPFRRSGFNVSAQQRNNKLIVHNYGHGGGGITLSWGSSHLAMELAVQTSHMECAVLGCGALGLTTARLMQNQGWKVTIYSKDLPPHTTSNVAGGQWSATSVFDKEMTSPAFMEQFEKAQRHSYRYFQNLVGPRYGVRWITNYQMLNGLGMLNGELLPEQYPYFYPQRRLLGPGEHPFPIEYTYHYDTMLVEPAVFLSALIQDFFAAGGSINKREFRHQDELMNLTEPVIINCTGLGAKELFDDPDMLPIKGQLSFLLPQPEVNYIIIGNSGLYMFPRSDGVLLGGTYDRNVFDPAPDRDDMRRIVNGHREFFTAMQDPWA
ncbi:MAG: FAD-dependent oxidoreductase [Gammaproteobacteria bacterium]|nr:FAD-dependent oxidoreductase [Gammaproteobacteria bacterium]